MPQYYNERIRNLRIGISSYTENELVLDVIGNTNIGGVSVTSSGIITSSNPGVSTVIYYGDGSNLFGVSAFNVFTQSIIEEPVYPTLATKVGVTSVGISTDQFVFLPSTGSVGIGTSLPRTKLDVIGNVNISGVVTALSFVGSGRSLTDVRIGIQSGGSFIGLAGTINFTGPGVSTVAISSDTASVYFPATVRNTSYTVAYEGQTIFPCSYTIGYVEVYFNGSKLSPTQYDANDGANVILYEPASANDVLETIGYNGILKLYASKTILTDVSADGLIFYTGKAAVGIATTEPYWTIRRSLFSSAGIVTSTGIARNIAWINRSTGIYT